MPATFEQVKKLFLTYRDPDTSDSDFDLTEERLQEILPESLFSTLDHIDDTDGAEFENAYYGEKPKPKAKTEAKPTETGPEPTGQRVPGGYPELLPWPPNKEGVVEFPDYAIDF